MKSDISKLHKGTDGFYYEDHIAPDKPETFVGKLVNAKWRHKGVRFVLIHNFQVENGRRIALFAFQRHTGSYGLRGGAVNLKRVKKNTLWEYEVRKTRTGRYIWMGARQIVEPKTDVI